MAEDQVQRRRPKREQPEEADATVASSNTEKLKDDIDDLLDEIDTVLEENAEEFVRSYVQKGGQ